MHYQNSGPLSLLKLEKEKDMNDTCIISWAFGKNQLLPNEPPRIHEILHPCCHVSLFNVPSQKALDLKSHDFQGPLKRDLGTPWCWVL